MAGGDAILEEERRQMIKVIKHQSNIPGKESALYNDSEVPKKY